MSIDGDANSSDLTMVPSSENAVPHAGEGVFVRGERRLAVSEYIGLVASCQSAFDAVMVELSPASQVAVWNSSRHRAPVPSSGRRTLWALRRGVLDDLAPRADELLPAKGRWAPTKNEQLVFRAVMEALATGRQTQAEITGFCNEIYAWSSVRGVAEYLKGDLATAVALAAWVVEGDKQPRREKLPSWALVGTLLDQVASARDESDAGIAAFTAALRTLLGPGSGVLTLAHSQLLARLYRATRAGRKPWARESALRSVPRDEKGRTTLSQDVADRFPQIVQELESLGLIQRGNGQEICWRTITLAHLAPGKSALAQPS